MANLNKILNLVAEKQITSDQGELLVADFFRKNSELYFGNSKRPSWLYASEENEIIHMFKAEGKIYAVKQLKAISSLRGQDTNIYGLKWCKEYVESICDKL